MNNKDITALAQSGQPTLGTSTGLDTSSIDMAALIDEWKLSSSYVQQYTTDFPQLSNLVDGVPITSDTDAVFVGDNTLPGLTRSIPRDSLEQLPVLAAVVNGTKLSIPALLCTYFLKRYSFNQDTFGKGLLSTLQLAAEQAVTLGYAPLVVALGEMFNDFGTTMRLLHFSDTSPEPGITDHNETGYDYVVSHLTPTRVKKILAQARSNPNTSWNIHGLERVLEQAPRATEYSKYQSQPKQNQAGEAASPTYEFINRIETGTGSTKITFCPEVPDEPLRVIESRSKWGYPQVLYLVIDPAALTPFGTSRVRLASPTANLLNIYYGNIAAMLLLNSKPPIFKRGRFTTPVQLSQGVVWETMDPNGMAELKNLDNGSLQFFPQMAAHLVSQIQTIMGGRTVSTNSGGKSSFGKTAPGEKRAQEFEDSGTNQITKILENTLRQYGLVSLDLLLSEQTGTDRVIVDDETKNAINLLVPGTIGDDNKIEMTWEEFYAAIEEWSVEVTVSLSKDEMDEKKRGDLQNMITVDAQTSDPNDPQARIRKEKLENALLEKVAPEIAKTMPEEMAQTQTPTTAPVQGPVQ